MSWELVSGPVHELSVVDVEHDREQLGLTTLNLEHKYMKLSNRKTFLQPSSISLTFDKISS